MNRLDVALLTAAGAFAGFDLIMAGIYLAAGNLPTATFLLVCFGITAAFGISSLGTVRRSS